MDIQLSEVWVYNVKFAKIELIKKNQAKTMTVKYTYVNRLW